MRDADKDHEPVCKRRTYCPECGAGLIQEREGDDWCEECGWPDECRTEEGVEHVPIGQQPA